MKKLLFICILFSGLNAFSAIKYVTQNGSGSFGGTSWANAINGSGVGLALVLNSSGPTDSIWVAAGIYYTNAATTQSATAASTLTSFLVLGSKVFGGFAGNEININQRNIAANPTILSGNIGQDLNPLNNARHVVRMSGDNPVLDGFIVQDGYADGSIFVGNPTFANENIPLHGSGGGLLIYGQPVIFPDTIAQTFTFSQNTVLTTWVRNCVFKSNYSSGYQSNAYGGSGAAIFASWKTRVVANFEKCTFKNNNAAHHGGAIYATSSKVQPLVYKYNNVSYTNLQPDSINGDLTLKQDSCVADSNTTSGSGGAIYFDITNSNNFNNTPIRALINGCVFSNNRAISSATIAISTTNSNRCKFDSLRIENSRFENNAVTMQSGSSSVITYTSNDTSALFKYYLYNCSFINNRNLMWGSSGVFVSSNIGADRGVIRKCNFSNNKSSFGAACLSFAVGNNSTYPQLYKSSIIVDSCVFRNNSDSAGGANGIGAIEFHFTNPTDTFFIQNSSLVGNRGGMGTAYFDLKGPLKMSNCIIDSNNSNQNAIASTITILGSRINYSMIEKCSFRQNNYLPTTNSSAQTSGAIYYAEGSSSDTTKNNINSCLFENNRGGSYGGAIVSTGSSYGFERLTINNSIFRGNTSAGVGGAISSVTPFSTQKIGSLTISNCLITGNTSAQNGGGIYFDDLNGRLTVFNSTIASNYVSSTGQYGAGIHYAAQGSPDTCKIYNSIIWGNVANGNPHAELTRMGSSQPKVKLYNTIVKDGFNAQLYGQDDKTYWQNLYLYDPQFVSPLNAANAPTTGGNYFLQYCSPAINRGDNATTFGTKDISDSTRIKQGVVDLGAYETSFNNGMQVPVAFSNYSPACEFNLYQLFSSNTSGSTSIQWTGPNNFTSNSPNPIIIAPNHLGISDSTVVYRLQVFYPNSCSIDDTVAVYVKTGPYINITNNDTAICGNTFSTTLNSTFIPGVTTPDYTWRLDSLTSIQLGTSATLAINLNTPVNRKYYLKGTDPYTNCSYTDSVIIQLKAKPVTSVITGNTTVQKNTVVNYSVINTIGSSYNWFIQAGAQTAGGNTNAIQVTWGNNVATGSVKTVETSINGCKGDTVFLNNINVLPITLVSFTGKEQTGKAVLTWSTSSEVNNSHFEVERSFDGVRFTKVGEVTGSGNSNTLKTYRFVDELTNAKVIYYRLKQVDFNGAFEYSNIINLTTKALNALSSMSVYPNPATNSISVDGLTEQALVYDAVGRLVLTVSENGLVDVSHLTPGVYFVKTSNETVKFVKQ